jgi:phosphoribosyl 1,2-cyclic phosphodiesterase
MEGFIKFIGTGGARIVVAKQVRSTGGLWLNYRNTNVYIDPGPGALVRVHASRDHLEPSRLDGIILTHKHLDHANDINVMAEAMTEGGLKRKGVLFCPRDAIEEDPVVLRYVRDYVERTEVLKANGVYAVKDIEFEVPVRHIHPVEAYGLMFGLNKKIGLITDTRFFEELPDFYCPVDVLIVNVLRVKPILPDDRIDHLSLADFKEIIVRIRPKIAIMTHFGMSIIKEKPYLLAKSLKQETGLEVVAAYDGMRFDF